jgi:hypothetical protein
LRKNRHARLAAVVKYAAKGAKLMKKTYEKPELHKVGLLKDVSKAPLSKPPP